MQNRQPWGGGTASTVPARRVGSGLTVSEPPVSQVSQSQAARRLGGEDLWSVSCRRLGCPRSARIFSVSRTEWVQVDSGAQEMSDNAGVWVWGWRRSPRRQAGKIHSLSSVTLDEHVTPLRSVTGLVGAHPIHLVYRSRPPRRSGARPCGPPAPVPRRRWVIDGVVPQKYPGVRGGEEVGFGANAAADPPRRWYGPRVRTPVGGCRGCVRWRSGRTSDGAS